MKSISSRSKHRLVLWLHFLVIPVHQPPQLYRVYYCVQSNVNFRETEGKVEMFGG